jgi:hypothetical protein
MRDVSKVTVGGTAQVAGLNFADRTDVFSSRTHRAHFLVSGM